MVSRAGVSAAQSLDAYFVFQKRVVTSTFVHYYVCTATVHYNKTKYIT